MSHWDFGRTPPGTHPDLEPAGADDRADGDWGEDGYPLTFERDPSPAPAPPFEPATPQYRPADLPFQPPSPSFQAPGPSFRSTAAPAEFRPPPPPLPRQPEPWLPAGPAPEADQFSRPGRAGDAGLPPEAGFPPQPDFPPEAATWPAWDPEDEAPGRRVRRWLLPASIAVGAAALGAAATLLAAGQPSAPAGPAHRTAPAAQPPPGTQGAQASGASAAASPPPAASAAGSTPGSSAPTSASAAASAPVTGGAPPASGAPLTLPQARAVLAQYTAANNQANAARSDQQLAAIETGSSLAIDAGLYRLERAADTPAAAAFAPAAATYYIPRGESGGGTRWFAVRVANAPQSTPGKVTSAGYLLFTQAADGAWREALEPVLLPGASTPSVTIGTDGLATAVTPDASSAAVAPGRLAGVSAASLDGAAADGAQIADPGNLSDLSDQSSWRKEVPQGMITDRHAAASGTSGQEFALLTADGGALVFYTDAATLTINPPTGRILHVTLPGFYSASQSLARAGLTYLEQFAAYDPPPGGGAPRVVADLSAITGTSSSVPAQG